jgi:hypothetical protein
MKLKDKVLQPAIAGLPASRLEWWDIGNGYEISVSIDKEYCSLGISAPDKKSITYEIASLLGVDTSEKSLVKRHHDDEELYVSMGIDCVVLNYRKPENYKQLMEKIETIVNENFKRKR